MATVVQMGNGSPVALNSSIRNTKGSRVLAITQLLLGFILIILDIASFSLGLQRYDIATIIGGGIWAGGLTVITGVIGILASRSPTNNVDRKCIFIAFLTLSVICCLAVLGMGITSIITIALRNLIVGECNLNYYYYDASDPRCRHYIDYGGAVVPVRVIAATIYGILVIALIVNAVFSCTNICCSKARVVTTHHHVTYHQPGQPIQRETHGYPPMASQKS